MAFIILGALSIVLFVFVSAVFSFSEMSLASSNKVRLTVISRKGTNKEKIRAHRVLDFIENYNEMVTTIVVTNNMINIFITTFSAYYFGQLFTDSAVIASIISFLLMTFLIVFFGELLPKMYARKYSDRGIMYLSFILLISKKILIPITILTNMIMKQSSTSSIQSEAELLETISEAEKYGITSKNEKDIIDSVLRLDETVVNDVMIKKSNVEYVYDDLESSDYFEYAKHIAVTRIPVLDRSGRIKHIWNVKKYLIAHFNNVEVKPEEFFSPFTPYFKEDSIHQILRDLKKKRQKIGVIVDKSNVLIGLITIEDIVETFLGNIYDEFDVKEDGVYKIDNRQYIVEKNVAVQYLFNKYLENIKIPSNISKSITIDDWFLKNKRKKSKNYKIAFNDQIKYANLIIWVKQDTKNHKNHVFEIDII